MSLTGRSRDAPPHLHKHILPGGMQLSLFGPHDHPVLEDLAATDLDTISPIEALKFIVQWQEHLNAERQTSAVRRSRR